MKLAKSMALMAIGAGTVIAYQKYNKPVMSKMKSLVSSASNKLENMMN